MKLGMVIINTLSYGSGSSVFTEGPNFCNHLFCTDTLCFGCYMTTMTIQKRNEQAAKEQLRGITSRNYAKKTSDARTPVTIALSHSATASNQHFRGARGRQPSSLTRPTRENLLTWFSYADSGAVCYAKTSVGGTVTWWVWSAISQSRISCLLSRHPRSANAYELNFSALDSLGIPDSAGTLVCMPMNWTAGHRLTTSCEKSVSSCCLTDLVFCSEAQRYEWRQNDYIQKLGRADV